MNTYDKVNHLEYVKKQKMIRVELLMKLLNDALIDYHKTVAEIEELKADLDYE